MYDVLNMWVVYKHPKDYPHSYVARRFEVNEHGARPTTDVRIADTLNNVRAQLPMELIYTPRQVGDEPHILEVWL